MAILRQSFGTCSFKVPGGRVREVLEWPESRKQRQRRANKVVYLQFSSRLLVFIFGCGKTAWANNSPLQLPVTLPGPVVGMYQYVHLLGSCPLAKLQGHGLTSKHLG
ncbi:hypothetical protein ASPSYDRAFT_40646 [Aspergillus sydowii CBS 593.65]|uniref:Uncharacterized protein n=1 Tax=Aspergillus sydowii CBS 593.65 TaxID=1036612 RepID=A0A1L9TRJ0_9EURO|nr:uncharacterized protein ASPSYDRAFT_40646 [Aspergillus sydowii CBS 593.65]OJJ62056.1 hypothetical protein ASPSYDRAFT_40646 [Aspergillus sydowii CBS 593.65]